MKYKIILVCFLLVCIECKQKNIHSFELIEESFSKNFNFYSQLWEEKNEDTLHFQVKIFSVTDKDRENLMLRDSLEREFFEGRISEDDASMEIVNNLSLNFNDYLVLKDSLYKRDKESVDFKNENLEWSLNKRILLLRHINEEVRF